MKNDTGRRQRRQGDRLSVDRRPRPERHLIEFVFLPGLAEVARREVADRVQASAPRPVPGRSDAFLAEVSGSLRPLLNMRTIVAPFLVLRFDVPRPKALLSGEHLKRILEAMHLIRSIDPRAAGHSFRFDAAGADSSVFLRLTEQIAQATRLRHDPEDGAYVLRFRRTADRTGWEVLIRLSPRPLSARAWRVSRYASAANATVAAAMVRMTGTRPTDRVVNLMCGSGTLLVERLLAAPVAAAVGVDMSGEAIEAATANLRAAGVLGQATLVLGDIADARWQTSGPYDVLLADPPWGDKIGSHAQNESLHVALLRLAYQAAAAGARFAVLTHEIRIMERCLRQTDDIWRLESETRVFHKGHHPRIYLLRRR